MTQLVAGRIEVNGKLTDNSMAKEIETALEAVLPRLVTEDPRIRQKLAVAIARGVIKHLHANHDAVRATKPDDGTSTHEHSVTIDADVS